MKRSVLDIPFCREMADLGDKNCRDHGICTSRITNTPKNPHYAGRAHADGTIEAPWPTTCPSDLHTLCHEIGHIVLEHHFSSKPDWLKEYEADKYARKLMRQYKVPRARDIGEQRRGHIADELTKAAIAGEDMTGVPLSVRRWAKWGVA